MFSEVKPAHGIWLHLLDDGFSTSPARSRFDIVIVRPKMRKKNCFRQDICVNPSRLLIVQMPSCLRKAQSADWTPIGEQHVWRVTRRIELDTTQQDFPKKPFVLCSIARPERFINDLRGKGAEAVGQALYPDHYQFGDSDIRAILNRCATSMLTAFLPQRKMQCAWCRPQRNRRSRACHHSSSGDGTD